MEDVRIIELFFDRDEAALRETQRKYGGRLTALACSITKDPQDAEECVNDTYLEVWQAIPPARPAHLFAFLAKILRHNALTVCEKRHAKKREGVTVELTRELAECLPDSHDPATEEDSAAIRKAMEDFLRAQDPLARKLFLRRYFYAVPIAELAEETGLTESAVTSRLHRLREKLRTHLGKEGIGL